MKEAAPAARKFCDAPAPCIFDIGLNTGQDARAYLSHTPSTRVVAVEASPPLISAARDKFAQAVTQGRLKLLNIGLVGNSTRGEDGGGGAEKLVFWSNTKNNKFSSFKQRTGCRSPRGDFLEEGNVTFCEKVEMEVMSCQDLVDIYGTPVYMKIDIEGMDRACLLALGNLPAARRPRYVSKENVAEADVAILTELGYTGFKVVNQALLQVGTGVDDAGHSGPWGENAVDMWIGRKWHSADELRRRMPTPPTVLIQGVERKGWYDLHARK